MAYITTSQLSSRLGSSLYARLTDRDNGTTADAAVAQQIVDEAEAEADSYLAKRYATPVDLAVHTELAQILETRVLDLAEHGAWKGSPFVSDIPQRVQASYAEAVRWFEMIVRGDIHLPASTAPASRTAEDESPRYSGETRQFTGDELDGL